ncbi:MAG: hypothetical protein EB060_01515 [Proteobacteria bacterium]|nr:hypothetical protein [Pseudomonadota bacterium]
MHAAELIAQLSPHTVPAALPSIVAGKEAIYLEVTESNILTHEVVLGDLTSEYRPTAFIGTAEHPAVVEAVVVAPNLDIDLRFGRCRSCMLQTGARNTGRLYIDNSRIDSVIIGPEHSGFIEGGFASDFGRVLIGHGKNNGLVLNGTAGAVVTGPGYQDVLTLCSYTRTALHSHDATGSLTLGLMEFSQPDAEFAFYNHETGETHPITLRGTYYGKEGGEQVLKMVYNDTLALGSLLIMQDAHGSDERSIAASVPENIINRTREKGRKDRTAAAVTSLGEATGDLGDLSKERVEKGPPPRP